MHQPQAECCIPVEPTQPGTIEPKCALDCQEIHYRAKTLAKLARAFKVYVEQELQGAENCLAQKSMKEDKKSKKDEDDEESEETGEEKEAEGEFFQALSEFFSEELKDKLKDPEAKEMCENVEEWREDALEKCLSQENEEAVNGVLTELCSTYVEAISQQ